jgi:hypothetical protein
MDDESKTRVWAAGFRAGVRAGVRDCELPAHLAELVGDPTEELEALPDDGPTEVRAPCFVTSPSRR